MREILTITETATFEGREVVQMMAEIHSDEGSQMYRNISILNHDLYTDNLEYFRKEIEQFDELVKEREDYIFTFYDKDEEAPESPSDPNEEPKNEAPKNKESENSETDTTEE